MTGIGLLSIDFSNDFSVSSSFLDLADDFSITSIRVVRQAPSAKDVHGTRTPALSS